MVDYFFAPDRLDLADFTIRSYDVGDGVLMSEAVNNSYEHLKTYMPWAKPYQANDESEAICRRFRARYLLAEDFPMGIFSPSGDRVLGSTGYHLREGDLSTRNAEIGMWIRADAAGQGLGTRVLVALLRWGFDAWPWMRQSWRCDVTNIASARTAEKAGMQREGLLRSDFPVGDGLRRDTYIYAALREPWLAQHDQSVL